MLVTIAEANSRMRWVRHTISDVQHSRLKLWGQQYYGRCQHVSLGGNGTAPTSTAATAVLSRTSKLCTGNFGGALSLVVVAGKGRRRAGLQ